MYAVQRCFDSDTPPNASILSCTMLTRGGSHRHAEILEDHNVLIEAKATIRPGDTLVPLNFVSDGKHLSNFAGDKPGVAWLYDNW